MLSGEDRPGPITDLLRRVVLEAVEAGRTTYLALERETGVTRASIMRFVRGSQSLRLDMADRLAGYFSLVLRRKRKGR
jgi:plasmid maintenance system antidote protein VapI